MGCRDKWEKQAKTGNSNAGDFTGKSHLVQIDYYKENDKIYELGPAGVIKLRSLKIIGYFRINLKSIIS